MPVVVENVINKTDNNAGTEEDNVAIEIVSKKHTSMT